MRPLFVLMVWSEFSELPLCRAWEGPRVAASLRGDSSYYALMPFIVLWTMTSPSVTFGGF